MHKSNINNRKGDTDADLVSKLYSDYMSKTNDINLMRQQLNKMKQITSDLMKKGGDTHQVSKDIKKHYDDISKFQIELSNIEKNLMNEALRVPNITHPDSPIGSEENAKVIKLVGEKRMNIFLNKF
jgi:seryl-tRNA synthetase